MQRGAKIVLLVAVIALVVVLALIALNARGNQDAQTSDASPAPEMYEGATAGLTEEEIGALAVREEGVSVEDPSSSD